MAINTGLRIAYILKRRRGRGGKKPLVLPGLAFAPLWFDAQDINAGAGQPLDGAAIATWKNKGSIGAGGDCVQATGANRPLFKTVGAVGKLNNLSTVRFDGANDFLVSADFTALTQPTLVCLIGSRNGAASQVFCAGNGVTNRNQIWYDASVNKWALYAGAVTDGALTADDAKYTMFAATFNFASSVFRVNGANNAIGNPGNNVLDGFSLGGDEGGGAPLNGDIVEAVVYVDTAPNLVARALSFEAYAVAKYGAFSQ